MEDFALGDHEAKILVGDIVYAAGLQPFDDRLHFADVRFGDVFFHPLGLGPNVVGLVAFGPDGLFEERFEGAVGQTAGQQATLLEAHLFGRSFHDTDEKWADAIERCLAFPVEKAGFRSIYDGRGEGQIAGDCGRQTHCRRKQHEQGEVETVHLHGWPSCVGWSIFCRNFAWRDDELLLRGGN